MRYTRQLLIFIGFFATSFILNAQTSYELIQQQAEIQIDGSIDESVWSRATLVDLKWENEPEEGQIARVKTHAWLFQDAENLYVAFKAYDNDLSKLRASLREYDDLWLDDNVILMIDTFNDERTGYQFYVNPLGAMADTRMTDYDSWNEDASWNGIWESAAKINQDHYIVEMRIPFSTLRFPDASQKQTWGFALYRNMPRDVRYQMSNVRFDLNIKCSFCQFDKLTGFENAKPGKSLQLTPTLTMLRSDVYQDGWQSGDLDVEPGLDLRYGISSDAVLNATINPDFSQIEADSPQLDVNETFALYYDEKRPFYLDGSDYFDTQSFNLVHTRNISDPDVGLKVTGKSQQHSYGMLYSDDQQSVVIIPGKQGSSLALIEEKAHVAVSRYQLDYHQRDNVGALITHRQSESYHNTVASIDGATGLTSQNRLSYQVAYSDTQMNKPLSQSFGVDEAQKGGAYQVHFERETRNYTLEALAKQVDNEFRADLGFVTRSGYQKLAFDAEYRWYNSRDSIIYKYGTYSDVELIYDIDGGVLEREYEISAFSHGVYSSQMDGGLIYREEKFGDEMFTPKFANFWVTFRPINDLKLNFYTYFGKDIDYSHAKLGDTIYVSPSLNWDINRHLQLDFDYNYEELKHGKALSYRAHLSDLRLTYKFNVNSIISFTSQYRNVRINDNPFDDLGRINKSRGFSNKLVYSYKINPQTLFYLGYSDQGFVDSESKSLRADKRTFFTKFSYAWQL